jgi:ABC-type transport system involved in multi-copper enzyme maturation permease subunit
MNTKSLFQHELHLSRKTFVTWLGIIAGLMIIFASTSSMLLDNDEMAELLKSYPPALLESFNINPESFITFEGWMSSEPYIFLNLLLGIFAILLSAASVSREIDDRTGEFLFTVPLSRRKIFLVKAASHLLQLSIVFAIAVAAAFLTGQTIAEIKNASGLFLIFLSAYFISLACMGIGYLLTCLIDDERTALSLGVGYVLLSFLFNMLAGLKGFVGELANVSIFRLFDVSVILEKTALSPLSVAITLGLYLLGLIAAGEILARKNLAI